MRHCPVCRDDYEATVERCADCGTRLVELSIDLANATYVDERPAPVVRQRWLEPIVGTLITVALGLIWIVPRGFVPPELSDAPAPPLEVARIFVAAILGVAVGHWSTRPRTKPLAAVALLTLWWIPPTLLGILLAGD